MTRAASSHERHADEQILPRVLVFSESSISAQHGTGAIFLRNFARYPATRLCNVFIGSSDNDGLSPRIDLNAARWPSSWHEQLAAAPTRLANRLQSKHPRALPASDAKIARALAGLPFAPELIYAICWSAEGLVTLRAVLHALPGVPLLLHFHDFWPSASASFIPLLREIRPRVTAAWAVSTPIARFLEANAALACSVEPQFHVELPALHRREHRAADTRFRAVIIGNFWNAELVRDVQAAWSACQAQLPWLGPVQWFVADEAVARLRARHIEPEPELQPMGFLRGDELWRMLAENDLALVPFSREAAPQSDYERFSLPSRITELAAAGLPLFALTGDATALADYVREKQIGLSAPSADTPRVTRMLHELILARAQRETLGRRARALAESEFPLGPFQDLLYRRLAGIAQGRP